MSEEEKRNEADTEQGEAAEKEAKPDKGADGPVDGTEDGEPAEAGGTGPGGADGGEQGEAGGSEPGVTAQEPEEPVAAADDGAKPDKGTGGAGGSEPGVTAPPQAAPAAVAPAEGPSEAASPAPAPAAPEAEAPQRAERPAADTAPSPAPDAPASASEPEAAPPAAASAPPPETAPPAAATGAPSSAEALSPPAAATGAPAPAEPPPAQLAAEGAPPVRRKETDEEKAARRKAALEAREAAKAAAAQAAAKPASPAAGAGAKEGAAPEGGANAEAPPPPPPSPSQPRLDRAVQLLRESAGEDAVEEAWINEPNDHLPTLVVKNERWPACARLFRDHPELNIDYLRNVSGVDYETYMEVVYHLLSLDSGHVYAVKVRTDRDNPSVPSATPVWETANWNEREIYDLLGIDFPGHPDLRRIMMPDDWVGHPLRKDYEPLDPEV